MNDLERAELLENEAYSTWMKLREMRDSGTFVRRRKYIQNVCRNAAERYHRRSDRYEELQYEYYWAAYDLMSDEEQKQANAKYCAEYNQKANERAEHLKEACKDSPFHQRQSASDPEDYWGRMATNELFEADDERPFILKKRIAGTWRGSIHFK